MTLPRATTSPLDSLAADLGSMMARIASLEVSTHSHATNATQILPVGGIIDWPDSSTIPAGFAELDGSTITNGQNLYPILWSVIPAGWQSGSDIDLPDFSPRLSIIKLG